MALSMASMMAEAWVARMVGATAVQSDVPLVVGMVGSWAD